MTRCDDPRHLTEVLCWMGGTASWPADLIAEQLGCESDPALSGDLRRATQAGLLTATPAGFRLTDAGWALAAEQAG